MSYCSDILIITQSACRVAECLTEEEILLLNNDLLLFRDTLTSVLIRRRQEEACIKDLEKKMAENAKLVAERKAAKEKLKNESTQTSSSDQLTGSKELTTLSMSESFPYNDMILDLCNKLIK